jgi:hypothetical protein
LDSPRLDWIFSQVVGCGARYEIPAVLSPEGERKRSRIFTDFKAA